MTPAELELILRRVLDSGVTLNTTAYVGMILALLAGTVLGAFLGAYAKRKGENRATREDLASIVEQMKLTTAVAEETKAAVLHVDRINHDRWILKRDTFLALVRSLSRLGVGFRTLATEFESKRKAGVVLGAMSFPKTMMLEISEPFLELINLTATSQLFCSEETIGILLTFKNKVKPILMYDASITDGTTLEKMLLELSREVDSVRASLVNDARLDLFGDTTIRMETNK